MPNHVRNKVKMTGIANLPLFTTKTDEYTKEQFTFFDFNKLISSYARELYILDTQKGPFEPDDIRQCVYIEKREVMGQEYVDCKPAYCRKRWYMAGGNILYTSDSRFKQITGISYPIAIHDRYEGR